MQHYPAPPGGGIPSADNGPLWMQTVVRPAPPPLRSAWSSVVKKDTPAADDVAGASTVASVPSGATASTQTDKIGTSSSSPGEDKGSRGSGASVAVNGATDDAADGSPVATAADGASPKPSAESSPSKEVCYPSLPVFGKSVNRSADDGVRVTQGQCRTGASCPAQTRVEEATGVIPAHLRCQTVYLPVWSPRPTGSGL